MINHRNKQNYRFRTWKFRDRCHLTGGVRQGCFLSLILNNLIQYIHFHSLYITSHYYAKFKENPCVGTDARPPLKENVFREYHHSVKQLCHRLDQTKRFRLESYYLQRISQAKRLTGASIPAPLNFGLGP